MSEITRAISDAGTVIGVNVAIAALSISLSICAAGRQIAKAILAKEQA